MDPETEIVQADLTNAIKKFKQEISSLKDTNQIYSNQRKQMIITQEQMKNYINGLQIEKNQIQAEMNQNKTQVAQYQMKIERLENKQKDQARIIRDCQSQKQRMMEKINQLKSQRDQWQNKFDQSKTLNEQIKDQIQRCQQKNKILQKERRDLASKCQAAVKNYQKLSKQKLQLKNQLSNKNRQIIQKNDKVNSLKELNDRFKSSMQVNQKNARNNTKTISEQNTKIRQLQRSLLLLNQQKMSYLTTINDLQQKLETANRNCNQFQNDLQINQVQLQKMKLAVTNSFSQLAKTYLSKSQLELQRREYNGNIERITSDIISMHPKLAFFNGSQIIQRQKIQFLIKSLTGQPNFSTPIKQTKLLMKMEYRGKFNSVFFHDKVDQIESILTVIKLKTGSIIGGYSLTPLFTNRASRLGRGVGFIFSLSDERIFLMRQQANNKQPVITYDEYNFIMGAAELKLCTSNDQTKFYSNLGVSPSCFDSKNYTRQQFYKNKQMGNRQVEVEHFEFWHVQLEDK